MLAAGFVPYFDMDVEGVLGVLDIDDHGEPFTNGHHTAHSGGVWPLATLNVHPTVHLVPLEHDLLMLEHAHAERGKGDILVNSRHPIAGQLLGGIPHLLILGIILKYDNILESNCPIASRVRGLRATGPIRDEEHVRRANHVLNVSIQTWEGFHSRGRVRFPAP